MELVGSIEPGSTIRFVPNRYRDETLEHDGLGMHIFISGIRSEHLTQPIIWMAHIRKDRIKPAYFWFGGKSTSVTLDTKTGVQTVQAEREITAADIDSAKDIRLAQRGKILKYKPSKRMIPDEINEKLHSFSSGYEGSCIIEGERSELTPEIRGEPIPISEAPKRSD